MDRLHVEAFFHEASFTISYVVSDPASGHCAIIDAAIDYDLNSGRCSYEFADKIIAYIEQNNLHVEWILETHIHADHLSAASYLKEKVGGLTGISDRVDRVQAVFGYLFNTGKRFSIEGVQFDHLFSDQDRFQVGIIRSQVMHTPGHTPACVTYLIGDCAFVGDTLFMPDFGTARVDFPGGDAAVLYKSIQRIYSLPPETRMFMCHDYKAPGRDEYAWQTTVGEQRERNVHIHQGVSEDDFIKLRTDRDKNLAVPKLLLPAVQVNMCAGKFPKPETNGIRYLKVPIDQF